jgi:hypothetical protein
VRCLAAGRAKVEHVVIGQPLAGGTGDSNRCSGPLDNHRHAASLGRSVTAQASRSILLKGPPGALAVLDAGRGGAGWHDGFRVRSGLEPSTTLVLRTRGTCSTSTTMLGPNRPTNTWARCARGVPDAGQVESSLTTSLSMSGGRGAGIPAGSRSLHGDGQGVSIGPTRRRVSSPGPPAMVRGCVPSFSHRKRRRRTRARFWRSRLVVRDTGDVDARDAEGRSALAVREAWWDPFLWGAV